MPNDGMTLSAAERRERRLKRILGNSEERMKKILAGPDGDEQRLPPMLEGGEYRSSLLSSNDDESSADNENYTDLNMLNSNNSSCCPILQTVKRMDKPLNLLFGFLAGMLVASGVVFNVLIPWILISLAPHFFTITEETSKFINDLMTVLRSGSYSTLERILRRGNAAFAHLRTFTSRLLIMVCGFLIGHSVLMIFYGFSKDLTAIDA